MGKHPSLHVMQCCSATYHHTATPPHHQCCGISLQNQGVGKDTHLWTDAQSRCPVMRVLRMRTHTYAQHVGVRACTPTNTQLDVHAYTQPNTRNQTNTQSCTTRQRMGPVYSRFTPTVMAGDITKLYLTCDAKSTMQHATNGAQHTILELQACRQHRP